MPRGASLDDYELHHLDPHRTVHGLEEEETEMLAHQSTDIMTGATEHTMMLNIDPNDATRDTAFDGELNRRTVRKLDFILLPFLAILFLLNSLDKSNIGNAETAGFTRDAGLAPSDLNMALAFFFAFFVALQPVGAALGRTYGMARWVPPCMALWGLCTILHVFVQRRWQLICLRIAIASLEAGFYPTTVSYLSLFYTRYEFAVRLGIFYGQTAVAGALGGVLSWAVFSHFPHDYSEEPTSVVRGWKSWQVLFVIEGCITMVVALFGFLWLPKSAGTAWFFNAEERKWAEKRILLDRDDESGARRRPTDDGETAPDEDVETSHQRLLDDLTESGSSQKQNESAKSVTAAAGLNRQDVIAAIFSYNIWHLLICNMLSAIPTTAFGVFMPMVVKQLSPSLNLSPAASNLLSAPPFIFGAIVLFVFTRWSDLSRKRLLPILWSLGLLLIGLIVTVMTPRSNYVLRYVALCILLSGSFIASPITVAWLANNTPQPGKRAILLGINGWGNLAGVFSALLFTPADEETGYVRSFIVTLVCVGASFAGFIVFWLVILRENRWRDSVTSTWTAGEYQREEIEGNMPLPTKRGVAKVTTLLSSTKVSRWLGGDGIRRGDEKLTFRYGF
ncbi:Hypothetical protein R9X50_00127100 [Acrodontium crateriforme]|uniref:MFS general substrate transporter n=1 Tax=Acrodontium crateriforme TaxID=150365 RepID=A0AAQ3M275_9PEZI|nr:Hypothetical protein R9X50_00127100 [Acrodontium crateriforme]